MVSRFFRLLWLVFALLVIVYAVLVVAGRELLPVVNRYQPQINAWLSERTGMDFEIQALSGLWRGFTPVVDMESVVIAAADGHSPAVTVDTLSAELQLGSTLANRSPVWRALTAGRIDIELSEDAQGRWSLGGNPLGAGGNLDYLFEMFFYSRLLSIEQLNVDVSFFSGSRARIIARDIQVENRDGFHRATASLALEEDGDDIATFVFEGRGDPADADQFKGRGYFHLNRINLDGPLSTLASGLFARRAQRVGQVEMDLDLDFWFDWQGNRLTNGRGRVSAAELPLQWLGQVPQLTDVRADLTGWFTPGEDWGFAVQGMTGQWGGEGIEPVDFQFRQRVGKRWGELDIAANHVNLGLATELLTDTDGVGKRLAEVVKALRPSGDLRQVHMDVDFGGEQADFLLRAHLDAVAVESFRGAPAARGVNGYIEASKRKGTVILDSSELAIQYPQAYDSHMPYGHTRGRVGWVWSPQDHLVRVKSDLIDIQGEEGNGKALLQLELPTEAGGDPQMLLLVGMKKSHSRYLERYLPRVINPRLKEWLDTAVGPADIEEAGFIWRGSLLKTNEAGRSIQLYVQAHNATLDYRPGWPALEELSARIALDNRRLDAWLDSGVINGEPIDSGGVTLRQPPAGPMLRVAGAVATSLEKGRALLARSPLAEKLAGVTELDTSGNARVSLDLRIPLGEDRRGEDYRVRTSVKNGTLEIPGTALKIADINGEFAFSLADGLNADDIRGQLLGGDLKADIRSEGSVTRVRMTGAVNVDALTPYTGSYSRFLGGEIAIEGELTIPHQQAVGEVSLALHTTAEGLESALPPPFAKVAGDVLDSRADVVFGKRNTTVQATLGEKLDLALVVAGGGVERGMLGVMGARARLPDVPGFLVSGKLAHLDWSQWQPVFSPGEEGGLSVDISPRLDLTVDHFVVSDVDLGATHLTGSRDGDAIWHFDVQAPLLEGRVDVPPGDKGFIALNLERLTLPAPVEKRVDSDDDTQPVPEANGLLETLRPDDIPELDVAIKALYRGDELLGDIAFSSRRIPGGVLISSIDGQLRGIEVRPQPLAEDDADPVPAELRWTATENGYMSYFSGTLAMANIEDTLRQWNQQVTLSSQSAAFYSELGWQGSPWEVNLLALEGYLGIDIRDGQFYKATNAAANTLLKLVGLINFDTWLRRLRLDFSDFFSSGVSFDKVEGGLLFRRGLVEFDDPVVADMPSGKIRLLGSADMVLEQLDASLVATMPVGTNLPWVAGLLGGLPAAAGVYLTSKLFEKQVDQLSSIGYRIRGSFDDPDIEVERIFSDPTKMQNPPGARQGTQVPAEEEKEP